ncbi:Mediator of RNA polymerase II transcription subunit 25 [Castilleja foliolosa]|uniref:Mediator of RNA polymerase II transcription subunit 25 n=1 Tax=Castilleja foliolosa TaxID=1961234 RepID=A0ABD3EJC8_9LAMI
MVPKQLIVAVEGTAAVGPYWKTIVSDYLDKIIRSFCGNESVGQKLSTSQVEFSLVMFNAHGLFSGCLVQRSGWTKNMDVFFQWLSAIPFGGGGFNDAAIAEGLAEALMMFVSPNGNQNQNVDGQRHCILIAASNPYPLATPVYRPQPPKLEQSENTIETQPENHLSDAEALAKSFAQFAVSLSVICPKKLPKLRAIYNAGKRNPRAADPPVDNVKNPNFLVLISENFIEGRAALSKSGMTTLPSANQNPVKMDVTPVPPVSAPPSVSVPAANGSVLARQPIPVGKNVPPATVKVEPTTSVTGPGPAFPQMSSVPRPTSQPVPTLQTSSPISTPQETIQNNENAQDMKTQAPTIRPPVTPANVRILNDVAQVRQAIAAGNSIGHPSMGGPPMLSNVISSGMASSVPSTAQTVIPSVSSGPTSIPGSMPMPTAGQVGQNSGSASFTSAAMTMTGVSQPLSNLQAGVSMGGQTVPSMSQGNIGGPQMVQPAMGMNNNQNMLSGPGSSGMPPGMQPVGGNSNNSMTNMPLNQQASSTLQSAQSKYVKVWEGNLSGQRQGQPVFITRLEGYRSASASETLAANWPPTMQIVRLISQDHMNNKQYVGKADFLVFRAMDQHGFLGQLQEKKLCAVIQLPSQTLLLSVSDKAYRLIGMLFPGDMVVFKPQIPTQQQLQAQQQHQHLQQLQHQQQQMPQQQQQMPQQPQQLQQMSQQPQQLQQMSQQPQQLQQQQQQPIQMQQQQPPLMQLQQQQQMQQQQPQQQQQQMVGPGMNQAYMQGGSGQRQLLSQGGQVSSQGPTSMPGPNFMN